MAGAGTEVGRLYVKVSPDTDGFRRDLENQLKAATRGLDVKVPVELRNAAQVRAQLDSLARDRKAKLDISVNRAQLNDVMRGVSATMQVDAELSRARQKVDQFKATMRTDKIKVPIEATPDLGAAFTTRAIMRAIVGEPIDVEVNFRYRLSRLRQLSRDIGESVGNAAEVGRRGLRRLNDAFDGFTDGVGNTVRGLSRMGDGVAIFAGIVGLAAPAVALLSGALLTLPAALAAFATPAAAVALGLDGIKKAAESVKPEFDALKEVMSSSFEKGLTPLFQSLRTGFFPMLKEVLPQVSDGLVDMGRGLRDAVVNPQGLANIRSTIQNIGNALSMAKPGVEAFSGGLITLVEKLSRGFPGIAESFNRVGAEFDSWIQKITANGQLDSAMQTLKGTLSEISGLVIDIANWGFENLADPKVGAQIRQFAEDLRAIVNDTLPLLKSGFQDVATIVGGIRDLIDGIKSAGNWIEKITGAEKQTNQGKTSGPLGLFGPDGVLGDKSNLNQWANILFNGKSIAEMQERAKRAGEQTGSTLGQSVQMGLDKEWTNAPLMGNATDKLTQAITGQVAAAGGDTGVATQIADQIGGALAAAQAKIDSLGPQLQASLTAATAPLLTLGDTIGGAFTALNGQIIGMWSTTIVTLSTGAQQVVAGVGNAFRMLPNALTGPMSLMVSAASSGMQAVSAAFSAFGSEVTRVVTTSFGQLPGLVQSYMDQMNAALVSGGAMCVQTVSSWGAQMVSTAMSFAGAMQGAGASIGAAFASGLRSMTGVVAAAASDLMGAAKPMFPNSPAKEGPFSGRGWVSYSGQAVGNDFADGISSTTSNVVSTVKALMQAVKDVFGDASGLALNFNFGGFGGGYGGGGSTLGGSLGGLQSSMSGLAGTAQQFQDSMLGAVAPTQQLDASSKEQVKELTRQLALLEQRRKELELARFGDKDNPAIKSELEMIRQQKLALGLEKDKLTYAQKYSGTVSETTDNYMDYVKTAANMPVDFAMTAGQQAMTDLGMSGNGAIPALMQYGLQAANQFVFNVSSVDEALTAKDREESRQGMTYVGR